MAHQTLKRGSEEKLKGYVTQLEHVVCKRPTDLALSLGYSIDGLSDGYYLYLLIEQIGLPEFQWKERSRYSGGKALEWVEYKVGKKWLGEYAYVDRFDHERYSMDRKREPWMPEDMEIDIMMKQQHRIVNVLRGPHRIVKIRPEKRLGKDDFPDAPGEGVPQWELMVEKRFVCATFVPPLQSLPRGVFNASYGR